MAAERPACDTARRVEHVTEETTAELARSLSETARALFSAGSVTATLQQIVDLAVEAVDGCDLAGIFMVEGEQVTTPAYSDPLVIELDALQFAADEGPCLDAVSERAVFYADELADNDRWPQFGPAAAACGARSLLAVPLPSDGKLAALNLYARLPVAFGAIDRARGLLFATFAGQALTLAQVRQDDERRTEDLNHALITRELIGQAQGILMERERITAAQAFDVLRRASQHLNIKLREVALSLVETGESPTDASRPPPSGASKHH